MTTAAQAIRIAYPGFRPGITDEKVANVSGAQAGAADITSAFTRVTLGSGGSLVLPNLIVNDNGSPIYVVSNETTGNILVFAASGDTLNNSLNASLTIASNGFGVFVRENVEHFPYVAPDWAAAAFT